VKRLAGFARRFWRHRRELLPGVACIPLVALCDIRLTLWIGDALTRLEQRGEPDFLRRLFILLLGVGLIQGLFRYLQRWWLVGVSRRVEVELKQELFDALTRLSLSFHLKSRSGDITSRLTSDVENVRMLLGPGSMYVLGSLFMVPGSLIALFAVSPRVTLAMMVPMALVSLVMLVTTARLTKHSTLVQESLADISARAQESFAGIRVVKGYGLSGHENARFARASEKNRGHQLDLARVNGLQDALIHLAFDLSFLPVLVVGGWAMVDSSIAVGDLFKFIDLGFKVFWPVIALGWIAGLYPRAVASAERIDALLEERSDIVESASPRRLPSPRGALAFRAVGYTFPGAPRPALEGLTLSIPAGTTLGVVGPTGSGKSTLLNLIGRVFEARGELTLDGIPVREIALADLRGALAYVPQDSFLFSDTYRANLLFGTDRTLSDAQLGALVTAVSMDEEMRAFPDGLDQLIGERGVTLSGGQRQRTSIARALARDPRVLLLDDCLSAVDTETEARLLANLRRAGSGRTVVVAAHRLATVRTAEQIVVLREGRVEALGTHEELLERCAWYRQTWERQRMREELSEL
jgi:ATP-binding cassette subfamily B protein